jgi:MbtH protein
MDGDPRIYKVVINNEAQYSILIAACANPPGWHDAGKVGSREACLGYVRQTWTDMRPSSLRKEMSTSNGTSSAHPVGPRSAR